MGTNLRAEKIQAVFEKYGSDKAQHGYAQFYANHLPENPKSILEIGVKEGKSILSWKELFPETNIVGLDLFQEFPIPQIEGVTFWTGNQIDYRILDRLRAENFEIVIDDGSHGSRHQMITFYSLFQPNQFYFIEDTHCAF